MTFTLFKRKFMKNWLFPVVAFMVMIALQSCSPEKRTGMSYDNIKIDTTKDGGSLLLRDELIKEFEKNLVVTMETLDNVFNDDFFSTNDNPFVHMDECRKTISGSFHSTLMRTFDTSWGYWHRNRFGLNGIESSIEDAGDSIILEYLIPGMIPETLSVDINEYRIRLKCDIDRDEAAKSKDGRRLLDYVNENYISKILQIPMNVDVKGADSTLRGERVVIKFSKPK